MKKKVCKRSEYMQRLIDNDRKKDVEWKNFKKHFGPFPYKADRVQLKSN